MMNLIEESNRSAMERFNVWIQRKFRKSNIIDWTVASNPCRVPTHVKQCHRDKIWMIQESFELETLYDWHEDCKQRKKNVPAAKNFLAQKFWNPGSPRWICQTDLYEIILWLLIFTKILKQFSEYVLDIQNLIGSFNVLIKDHLAIKLLAPKKDSRH